MLEIDVVQSTDGVLYIFHDGAEKRLLKQPENIKTMDSAIIESFTYINSNYKKINYKVERLEDVLADSRGDALINIDRAWDIWPSCRNVGSIRDAYQIILKGPVVKEQLDYLDRYPTKNTCSCLSSIPWRKSKLF